MIPEARATADALLWQGALIEHLVARLPEDAAARVCPGPGWTVSQVLAHLADDQLRQASFLEAFLAGLAEPPAAPVPPLASPPQETVQHLAAGRGRLYGLLARLSGGHLTTEAFPGLTVGALLARFSAHYSTHAWDILEAVSELASDPLLFNWLMHIDYSADPGMQHRQLNVLRGVQERMRAQEGQE